MNANVDLQIPPASYAKLLLASEGEPYRIEVNAELAYQAGELVTVKATDSPAAGVFRVVRVGTTNEIAPAPRPLSPEAERRIAAGLLRFDMPMTTLTMRGSGTVSYVWLAPEECGAYYAESGGGGRPTVSHVCRLPITQPVSTPHGQRVRCTRCVARGVADPPAAITTVRGFDGREHKVCAACAAEHEQAAMAAERARLTAATGETSAARYLRLGDAIIPPTEPDTLQPNGGEHTPDLEWDDGSTVTRNPGHAPAQNLREPEPVRGFGGGGGGGGVTPVRFSAVGLLPRAPLEGTATYFPTIASPKAPTWTLHTAPRNEDGLVVVRVVELPEIQAKHTDGDRAQREAMALTLEWWAAQPAPRGPAGALHADHDRHVGRLLELAKRTRTEAALPAEVRAMFRRST